MLLLHQTGSVKIGEVLRYTITYTPANDRILPAPTHLFLKIRNTSTVALRAAFIHGPYTLYVSSAPSNFRANEKCENPRQDGVPEFEPNLKAGGTWYSKLNVPEHVRETAGSAEARDDGMQKSMTWIVEIASQVIFSTSASVNYEMLLGRDEKSLSLGGFGRNVPQSVPGHISDHQQSQGAKDGHHNVQMKGVFSKAIRVKVEDTAALWNTPRMPEWDDENQGSGKEANANAPTQSMGTTTDESNNAGGSDDPHKKQKNVHLVILTHGLHSNLGSDMLYMKESIDEATKQAKSDRRERRKKNSNKSHSDDKHPAEHNQDATGDSDDEEEVIVRGFSGNAVKTEKGIKYLGKRLAKYILHMTYPDQPYKPVSKSALKTLSFTSKDDKDEHGLPAHTNSSIRQEPYSGKKHAYKITSISFISHSLGGLVQTYAVAYVQKHSPDFFDIIKPINFIALASPFLGLNNENPLYVKFALEFGLVGRTGQDLGLTWRAPTALAKTGWSALVGIGESAHKKLEGSKPPSAKPLLRILPTGPAHIALKKFRNRTVYSNVVNDGIVPLRTSCLLFLDWSGLGKVEKARRENGLVGTMANWGWSELTGANANHGKSDWSQDHDENDENGSNTPTRDGKGGEVPQPPDDATAFDSRSIRNMDSSTAESHSTGHSDRQGPHSRSSVASGGSAGDEHLSNESGTAHNAGAFDGILNFFKSNQPEKSHRHTPKHTKIYKRSQTLKVNTDESKDGNNSDGRSRSPATTGEDDNADQLSAPPKTTFFEAAGDLISPPIVPTSFLINPASRPRTIFHDRVYHPDDIPPPPLKSRNTSFFRKSGSSSDTDHASHDKHDNDDQVVDDSAMKLEEKIARAYHRDLSWRKVLVRLEPDAHNNMIVRRKYANAYGWPVVKHLVDTHFADSEAANRPDSEESNRENAKGAHEQTGHTGNETHRQDQHDSSTSDTPNINQETHNDSAQTSSPPNSPQHHRTVSETRESQDSVPALNSMRPGNLARVLEAAENTASGRPPARDRQDSATWSDGDFADSDDDSDGEHSHGFSSQSHDTSRAAPTRTWNWTEAIVGKGLASPKGTKQSEIDEFLTVPRPVRLKDPKITDVGLSSNSSSSGGVGSGSVDVGVEELSIRDKDVVAGKSHSRMGSGGSAQRFS